MVANRWKTIVGVVNTSDDVEVLAAKENDDCTFDIAYAAYGGVKIITVKGVHDIVDSGVSEQVMDYAMTAMRADAGDDWEILFFIIKDNVIHGVYADDCNTVTVLPSGDHTFEGEVDIDESREFSVDEFDEVDEDALRLLSFA